MVEQKVSGGEFSDLPCLNLGENPNLTSYDMDDIRKQEVSVDDENDPSPDNIPDEVPQP